jgi:ArsR family transcriptional regulator
MGSYNCCSTASIKSRQVDSLVSLLKLVGEERRLKLLCILSRGEHCVCELMQHIKLSQSLISHHLKNLKDEDIVKDEKKGKKVFYSLTKKGKHITSLLFKL